MNDSAQSTKSFVTYARFVLAYTILVIMWGAYVRATGSGAGCGAHWPTCDGVVLPKPDSVKKMIEFSHRLTSGLSLLFVVGLFGWAFKRFKKGHPARKAAFFSLIFIIGEAAVGAMLVLLALVGDNDSSARAVVIALHLANTFLLLFWLTKTAEMGKTLENRFPVSPLTPRSLLLCLYLFVFIGALGAVVALGDTLFPAASLKHGVVADFSSTAHFLVRLRILHPLVAVFGSCGILFQMMQLRNKSESTGEIRSRALWVQLLLCLQLFGGVVNWLLLAPVWMQMVHLMLADVAWIALVRVYLAVQGSAASHSLVSHKASSP